MPSRSGPHADDTIFGRATVRDILGRRAGGQRYALAEARMIEPLSCGEGLPVTVRRPLSAPLTDNGDLPCWARNELRSSETAGVAERTQATINDARDDGPPRVIDYIRDGVIASAASTSMHRKCNHRTCDECS